MAATTGRLRSRPAAGSVRLALSLALTLTLTFTLTTDPDPHPNPNPYHYPHPHPDTNPNPNPSPNPVNQVACERLSWSLEAAEHLRERPACGALLTQAAQAAASLMHRRLESEWLPTTSARATHTAHAHVHAHVHVHVHVPCGSCGRGLGSTLALRA